MAGKRKSKSSSSEASPSNSASANKLKRTEEPLAEEVVAESMEKTASLPRKLKGKAVAVKDGEEPEAKFVGKPMKDPEARKRWPKRYLGKVKDFLTSFWILEKFCYFFLKMTKKLVQIMQVSSKLCH